MGLAFIPVYVHYLGVEAYGVVGIFVMLQAWLAILDMGMASTLSREMARFTAGELDNQSIRNLLRSIEWISFAVVAMIIMATLVAAPWLAKNWLRVEQLSLQTVAQAFGIMGFVIGLRFLENIYRSATIGLQKQVSLNVVTCVMSTLRNAGAAFILIKVSASIQAFFIWQATASIITVTALGILLYRQLPATTRTAKFSGVALKSVWRFAAGMLSVAMLGIMLTQIDKLILSKLLPLEEFSYYALAATLSGAIYMITTPVGQAFYPLFTQLVSRSDEIALRKKYHQAAQIISILAGSAGILLAVFPSEVMALWTQNSFLARKTAPLLSLLALGTLFNCLAWIPYQLQLAHGWTRLSVKLNAGALLLFSPIFFFSISHHGAQGGGWAWMVMNALYLPTAIHFMFKKILVQEKWHWYTKDVLFPLCSMALAALSIQWLLPTAATQMERLLTLTLALTMTLCMGLISTPLLKHHLKRRHEPGAA